MFSFYILGRHAFLLAPGYHLPKLLIHFHIFEGVNRSKIFQLINYKTAARQRVTCLKNEKKNGVTNSVSEIKRAEN